MSTKYPSIETVWERDKATNKLIVGALREPVNHVVGLWHISEKIDGTNIRVIYTPTERIIGGRTDAATLNVDVIRAVADAVPSHATTLEYLLNGKDVKDTFLFTIYGEAYGPGIQKNGARYSEFKRFAAFDVRFGDAGWWADIDERDGILKGLDVPIVPTFGYVTSIPYTRQQLLSLAPRSVVAYNHTRDDDVEVEGIVARPKVTINDKHGNRVIWKLCLRDLPEV